MRSSHYPTPPPTATATRPFVPSGDWLNHIHFLQSLVAQQTVPQSVRVQASQTADFLTTLYRHAADADEARPVQSRRRPSACDSQRSPRFSCHAPRQRSPRPHQAAGRPPIREALFTTRPIQPFRPAEQTHVCSYCLTWATRWG